MRLPYALAIAVSAVVFRVLGRVAADVHALRQELAAWRRAETRS